VVANEDPAPPMLVHGDFHPGNIVTADDELVAILDLEYMHFEKPVFDVAYGGMMFASSGRRSKLDFALLREFLRGYDEPAFFQYLIPNMVSAACLCAIWLAEQNDRSDDFKHFVNGAQYLSGLLQEDCAKILGLAADKSKG
jgi:aminoglycoside phosphotransferase (APT) family kinase protein